MTPEDVKQAIKRAKASGESLGEETVPTITIDGIEMELPNESRADIVEALGELEGKGEIRFKTKAPDALVIELRPAFYND
jgi:hypothetical protein